MNGLTLPTYRDRGKPACVVPVEHAAAIVFENLAVSRPERRNMQVEQDFTSRKLTLSFESGKRVELNQMESKEFERWFEQKGKEVDR